MNWDDPAERLALIERVGIDEYKNLTARRGGGVFAAGRQDQRSTEP